MTSGHPESHERTLGEIVAGALDRRDPQAQRQLADCSVCRQRLAEMDELTQSLGETGRFERDVLVDVSTIDNAPGLDAVDAIVRDAARRRAVARPEDRRTEVARAEAARAGAAPDSGRSRSRAIRIVVATIAAAALIVFAISIWSDREPEGPSFDPGSYPEELGGPWPCRLLAPEGDVPPGEFAPFRFEASRNPGETFQIRIYHVTTDGRGAEVTRSPALEEPRWAPTRSETREWPDEIYWEVCVVVSSRDTRACSESSRASRVR